MASLLNVGRALVTPPPYDAEIEYLESTGTQYIDTGVSISYDLRVVVKVNIRAIAARNTSHFFGGRAVSTGGAGYGITTANGALSSDYFGSRVQIYSICPTNRWLNIDKNKNVVIVDDTTITNTASTTTIPERNVYLFGFDAPQYNGSYSGTIRYSQAKIYKNDNLILDFIPVRVGQVGYMYDKVSGQLFGNSGTGDFILGPDK